MTDQNPVVLSVEQLFKSGSYVIPTYQRNYSWTAAEVRQLVEDIHDCAIDSSARNYHLGSLVVFMRDAAVFEIVDGQQRHTTLAILLAVLKNEYAENLGLIDNINIVFDNRDISSQVLKGMFGGQDTACIDETEENEGEPLMLAAYQECHRALMVYPKKEIGVFASYLLKRVMLIRTPLPPQTELSHYFEAMNNRGEQLAKHEVLKARMMNDVTPMLRTAFATIWDACANMDKYVQRSFPREIRTEIFGTDCNTLPENLKDIAIRINNGKQSKIKIEPASIAALLSKPPSKIIDYEAEKEVDEHASVVTFPNFLLHVLRIRGKSASDVRLDDKDLLNSFENPKFKPDPEEFIVDLLHCRMLLDRYIVRRRSDGNWGVKTLKLSLGPKGKKSYFYSDTFGQEENKQLVMLLSMFHVSFPAQIYKHWLSAALRYLFKRRGGAIDGRKFIVRMELISDRFLFANFLAKEPTNYFDLCFDSSHIISEEVDFDCLHRGTGVQNFIFNRLDYLLWRELSKGRQFSCIEMNKVADKVRNFQFTFRSSVEHHYPRNPHGDHPKLQASDELPYGADSFGNLCLISSGVNSKLSNLIPSAKSGFFSKSTAVESLKQAFMFADPDWDKWGPENISPILRHQKAMIELLVKR